MIDLRDSNDPLATIGELFRNFSVPGQGVVFVFRLNFTPAVDMDISRSTPTGGNCIPSWLLDGPQFVEVSLTVPSHSARMSVLLDKDELIRAARIRNENSRRTYMFAHSLVRTFFSIRLGVRPESLVFSRSALGRPELNCPATTCDFNLSYRQGFVAFAVSRLRIGIDLESRPARVNYRDIAERFFSSRECCFIFSSDDDVERRFLWIWTRQEALVKYLGQGVDAVGRHDVLPERVQLPDRRTCRISSWSMPDYVLSCVSQE